MTDNPKYADMPQGFSRALMQNMYAMQYFSTLPDDARQNILRRASSITSGDEMKQFVDGLIKH